MFAVSVATFGGVGEVVSEHHLATLLVNAREAVLACCFEIIKFDLDEHDEHVGGAITVGVHPLCKEVLFYTDDCALPADADAATVADDPLAIADMQDHNSSIRFAIPHQPIRGKPLV